ncbi:MAG: AMP-binding protein, partial [Mycobacteriales bacterium]
LDALVTHGDPDNVAPPPKAGGGVVLLTSGTTGRPKGAPRPHIGTFDAAVSLLSLLPLRARDTTVIAAPLFHTWGFAQLSLGLLMSSTYVLTAEFDAEATLRTVAENHATVLVAVPVMLSRVLALPDDVRSRYDTSSLRVVAVSGSALQPTLAAAFMDAFGEILYNLYGSTEVAWATVATPRDLRAAPGTVGRPPRGTAVRLLDGDGVQVPSGEPGRIFVSNDMSFGGYSGGGDKERRGALVATGDVGRFDEAGRLFVEGRDDEMIVSGGENVFPAEVEDCLAAHPGVAEVAVVGVEDAEFGQRLRAYVVAGAEKPSADELRTHVRTSLARHKVPRDVVFVNALPRNAAGKVVKRELR